MHLRPCPVCARHVRSTERACPFCQAAMADGAHAAPPVARRATSRAALLFAGVALTAGCGKTTGGPSDGGMPEAAPEVPTVNPAPPYGVAVLPIPAPDAGPRDQDFNSVPPYGVPVDKKACNPPFTVDAKGRKKYKPECL